MTGKWRACGSVVTLWPSTKQALGNHLILPQSIDNFIVDGAQGWEALQGNFMDHEHYCACVAKIPDTDPERVGLGIATNWRNRPQLGCVGWTLDIVSRYLCTSGRVVGKHFWGPNLSGCAGQQTYRTCTTGSSIRGGGISHCRLSHCCRAPGLPGQVKHAPGILYQCPSDRGLGRG